jgi:cytochrome b subunit of formate dehydrogenase
MRTFFLVLLFAGSLCAETGLDPENCLSCHGMPWMAVLDSTGVRDFHVDESSYQNSVHGRFSCRQCHLDVDQVPHTLPVQQVDCSVACHVIDPYTGADFSHRKMAKDLQESAHGKRGEGTYDDRKPGCKDCHSNSQYWQELTPELARAEKKCLACHDDYNELGLDFKHLALHMSEDQIWRHQKNFEACVRCHTDNELVSDSLEALMIQGTMVSSFLESFHGRGFSFGDSRSPVCGDCHGYHSVFSQTDDRSMIHANNIQNTCGTIGCHDGATVAFATAGSMHSLYSGSKVQILVWVKWIYIFLIIGTLGIMCFHNFLDWRAWKRHRPKVAHEPSDKPQRRFLRMNSAERISHVVMFVSFSILALTGAILWIPPEQFGDLIAWESFMPVRAWGHRIAAVVITLVGIYHVGYALLTRRGRALFGAMLPAFSDLRLAGQNISFMFGKRKERPAFGFFNYSEKLEYWAFAWGSFVMTLTGVILWFEHLGSKFIVDLSRLVHSLEAVLAVAAIVVWHFWNVHWKPGRWPMSEVWIDGAMDEHHMEEEHGALLADDAAEKFNPELLRLAKQSVERRHRKRDYAARILGWSFLAMTLSVCAVMIWSFSQYLNQTDAAQPTGTEEGLPRPLLDKEAALDNPSYPLRVAHEDVDWRYARFHSVDPIVVEDPNAHKSECLLCHAILPHTKNRKSRAYLNQHSRYMSCEACHAGEENYQKGDFRWIDRSITPRKNPGTPYHLVSIPENAGEDNFHSRIGLVINGNPLLDNLDSDRAIEYLNNPAPMNQARIDEVKDRFHDRIDTKEGAALLCNSCHVDEGGKIDFKGLGFDDERIRQLKSVAKTASVTDYEVFYLPAPY